MCAHVQHASVSNSTLWNITDHQAGTDSAVSDDGVANPGTWGVDPEDAANLVNAIAELVVHLVAKKPPRN